MDPINPIAENPEVSKSDYRSTMQSPNKGSNITVISMAVFVLMSLAIVGFLYYQNQQLKSMLASYQTQPTTSPTPTVTTDPTANWKTYTNEKYGFSFKYPELNVKTDRLTDNLTEINGLDSLVIQITPIQTTQTDPSKWWDTQQVEDYTKKPTSCFSRETVSNIKSLYEPNKTILNLQKNIVLLNNFHSKDSTCSEPPEVQILLVPVNGKIIKITYDWAGLSEQVLSTFQFTSPSPTPIHGLIPNNLPTSVSSPPGVPSGY